MIRLRYSVATLLLVVTFAAVCFALLRGIVDRLMSAIGVITIAVVVLVGALFFLLAGRRDIRNKIGVCFALGGIVFLSGLALRLEVPSYADLGTLFVAFGLGLILVGFNRWAGCRED